MPGVIVVPGLSSGGELSLADYPRQHGAGVLDVYYTAPFTAANASGIVPTTGQLRGFPVFIGKGGVLDGMGVDITGSVPATTFRVGIYKMTSDTNVYPNELVGESAAENSTVTAFKTFAIAATLESNKWYWFVINVSATAASFRGGNLVSRALGISPTGGNVLYFNNGIYVAQAYGAMPDPFPAGGTPFWSTKCPLIYWKFAA